MPIQALANRDLELYHVIFKCMPGNDLADLAQQGIKICYVNNGEKCTNILAVMCFPGGVYYRLEPIELIGCGICYNTLTHIHSRELGDNGAIDRDSELPSEEKILIACAPRIDGNQLWHLIDHHFSRSRYQIVGMGKNNRGLVIRQVWLYALSARSEASLWWDSCTELQFSPSHNLVCELEEYDHELMRLYEAITIQYSKQPCLDTDKAGHVIHLLLHMIEHKNFLFASKLLKNICYHPLMMGKRRDLFIKMGEYGIPPEWQDIFIQGLRNLYMLELSTIYEYNIDLGKKTRGKDVIVTTKSPFIFMLESAYAFATLMNKEQPFHEPHALITFLGA